MLRATALPATVILAVILIWMFFGDWQSKQATNTEATNMAAAAADSLYSTTTQQTSQSDNFSLQGGVAGAVPVTGDTQVTNTNDKKFMHATLHTTKGDIKIEFDSAAPNTVANFTKLAGQGFYDGTKFHRVIAGFMIQGGDPLTKDDSKEAMWGTGGPGYTFADEIHPGNSNVIGSVSMANAGPNTNGSQFFINVADNTFLDTKHTVFAHVVSGTDAVNAIVSARTDGNDRPMDPITITGVTLEQ